MNEARRTDEARWVILLDGRPWGPYTTDEVRKFLESGTVRGGDFAAREREGTGWRRLHEYAPFDRRGHGEERHEHAPPSGAVPEVPVAEALKKATGGIPARTAAEAVARRRLRVFAWAAITIVFLFCALNEWRVWRVRTETATRVR